MVRTRSDDLEFLRSQMMGEGEDGNAWLVALFSVMDEMQDVQGNGRKNTLASGAAMASANSGGAAFVNACHFLAVLAGGHEELTKKLLAAHVLDHVGGRLLRVTVATPSGTLAVGTSR